MDTENYDEPLFDQAVSFVIDKQKASVAGLQRLFRIGYNRASLIIERMEDTGIISAPNSNGVRSVNFTDYFQFIDSNKSIHEQHDSIDDMSNVVPFPKRN
ncbi:hypothetical protein IBT46_19175 [Erwinia sp. S38]|nr:hypothetical protein [Erwinia sp. S38]